MIVQVAVFEAFRRARAKSCTQKGKSAGPAQRETILAGPSSPARSLAAANPHLPLSALPCPHPPDQNASQAVPFPAAGPVAGIAPRARFILKQVWWRDRSVRLAISSPEHKPRIDGWSATCGLFPSHSSHLVAADETSLPGPLHEKVETGPLHQIRCVHPSYAR